MRLVLDHRRRRFCAVTATSGHAAQPDLAYGAYQRGLYLTAFREATAAAGEEPRTTPPP